VWTSTIGILRAGCTANLSTVSLEAQRHQRRKIEGLHKARVGGDRWVLRRISSDCENGGFGELHEACPTAPSYASHLLHWATTTTVFGSLCCAHLSNIEMATGMENQTYLGVGSPPL
jgi:hypothetical protein